MKKFILVTLLYASSPASVLAAPPPESELSESCKTFVNNTLPANGWKGDFIEVPQDWSKPDTSPKIKVFYYYDGARDLGNAVPILFLNGGPFKSYQSGVPAMKKKIELYDANKNFVFIMMDQRGTGCSVPLMPGSDSSVQELTNYASDGIARDAEALRQKLFPAKKWKLFAQSYGTQLALRYLHLFPEHLSEVHIFGPGGWTNKKDFFKYRILRQQEILPVFEAAYPDMKLDRAIEILRAHPENYCLAAHGNAHEVCGQALLDSILAAIGQGHGRELGTTENWDNIAALVKDLTDGNGAKFLKAAQDNLAFFRQPTSLVVSVLWSEDLKLIDGTNRSECEAAYAELRTTTTLDLPNLPLDECRIIEQAISPTQEALLAAQFVPSTRFISHAETLETLERYPEIQFTLYTGELDTYSQVAPLADFIGNPHVNYFHFLSSGHAGWMYEPIVWQRLMAP